MDYVLATTTADTIEQVLRWDSDGYYVVGNEEWTDISFQADVTFNGGTIGIAPRIYDTNFFMFMHIKNIEAEGEIPYALAELNMQATYDLLSIEQKALPALVAGQLYSFKVEAKETNFRIFLNDTMIFNVEYSGLPHGKVGVYATTGNTCSDIEVYSLFPDTWTSNIASIKGGTVSVNEREDENKYVHLTAEAEEIHVEQAAAVLGGKKHTLSFNAKGEGIASIVELNGTAPATHQEVILAEDWQAYDLTAFVSNGCTQVAVRFSTINGVFDVNEVQFEEKDYATGYIHNDELDKEAVRENSFITYPSDENIDPEKGSLLMWFSPSITYDATTTYKPVLFEYGTSSLLRLSYEGSGLVFQYGDGRITYITDLVKDQWYFAALTWGNAGAALYVNAVPTYLTGTLGEPDASPVLRIGHSADVTKSLFYGAIDETIILNRELTLREVQDANRNAEPITDNDSMIMRATFNYAFGNFNKSIIEATLAPTYGSPILIEKADGSPMRKVSFFDFYTGEYRTFNEEMVIYDKDYNYIEISYHDKDVDQESFKVTVKDERGVVFGAPYELRGRRIYLLLTDEEKNDLDGKKLYATYQLEDSYTVDFNIGVPDSFRVTLGKHDGQPVRMIYEGNDFTDERLATMVELNPLLNPNHEGFLYITHNDEQVTSFRVRATPDDLPANGGTEALVVVEPLDGNGNYISHCTLKVSCEYGTILPTYDEESIKLRERAGRFLYRYRPPILKMDDVGAFEVNEFINVIDQETGIGVQIPITLTTLREKNHIIKAGETAHSIAEHYGSTVSDIALANNETDATIQAYIKAHVGGPLQVPVNYSAKQLEVAPEEIQQDKMIADLINIIMPYMNKPVRSLPEGLGTLLDFNGDNMIGIQEMTWLRRNRLTTVLEKKHKEVLAWVEAN